ncbi:hypothetical protein Taro_020904 [Colocasia esculenta]|uniref:Uncharacterized protein n=1 Tax=Colocasia esculenta TaxID=4460 RepID=A0A843UXJ5_COLES|nr:hypothetical protein [Colocasia esculenta]
MLELAAHVSRLQRSVGGDVNFGALAGVWEVGFMLLRSGKSLGMAEYEDMAYHEDIYDEVYDSNQQLAQIHNQPHDGPSTSHVNAMDSQSPHPSLRHVVANASASIDLSQLVDILQNLQASQL